MASLGISEFTFGFAFLYEQVTSTWAGLTAAPILPSLQQEYDEGWDAKLPLTGTDFYYQFKLSDHLSRGNAKYIRDGTYSAPYYRIALHKNDSNRQHQRLRALSVSHPNTYYVAPEVSALQDFDSAFLAKNLTQRSRLIPLNRCGDITDDKQHYLTYQPGVVQWGEHSKTTLHQEGSFKGSDLPRLYRNAFESSRRDLARPYFEDIYSSVRTTASSVLKSEYPRLFEATIPLLQGDISGQDDSTLLRTISDLLAAVFGATLVFVGERRDA